MAFELLGVNKWIYGKLTGDATLAALIGSRAYLDLAPAKDPATSAPPAFPYAVFSLNSDPESVGNGASRLLVPPLYTVKLVTEQAASEMAAALAAMDAALTLREPEAVVLGGTTYTILGAYRKQSILYAELTPDGARINHMGGLYKIHAEPLDP